MSSPSISNFSTPQQTLSKPADLDIFLRSLGQQIAITRGWSTSDPDVAAYLAFPDLTAKMAQRDPNTGLYCLLCKDTGRSPCTLCGGHTLVQDVCGTCNGYTYYYPNGKDDAAVQCTECNPQGLAWTRCPHCAGSGRESTGECIGLSRGGCPWVEMVGSRAGERK